MQTKRNAWENEKRSSANTWVLRYHAITLVDPRAGRRSLSPGRGVHPDVAIWRPGTGFFLGPSPECATVECCRVRAQLSFTHAYRETTRRGEKASKLE